MESKLSHWDEEVDTQNSNGLEDGNTEVCIEYTQNIMLATVQVQVQTAGSSGACL